MKRMATRALLWPSSQPRYNRRRKPSRYRMPGVGTCNDLRELFRVMDAKSVIITMDVEVDKSGRPRYDGWDLTFKQTSNDPGVAVYYKLDGKPYVFACDTWLDLAGNLRAIYVTIQALRKIEKAGASQMAQQAYQGFAALGTAPCEKQPWNAVLGVEEDATADEIKKAYRQKAHQYHPDRGGSNELMALLTRAYREAMEEASPQDRGSQSYARRRA